VKFHYKLAHFLINSILRAVYGVRISGLENVPVDGPVIVTANHVSYADPPIVGSSWPRELFYLAKKELFSNRLFGWILGQCNAFPVDRDNLEPKTVKRIFVILRSGSALLMFPEGTRSKDGKLGKFRNGVAAISLKTGVPVIPVAVINSGIFYRHPFSSMLEVKFGKLIDPRKLPKSKLNRENYRLFNSVLRAAFIDLNPSWK